MQRPAEMSWSLAESIGDVPSKRSGHSLTIVRNAQLKINFAYLFGGCEQKSPPGPSNELYKLDLSNPHEFYWTKVTRAGNNSLWPQERWNHSCILYDDSKLLVFGGFRTGSSRYNDVWILDCVNDKWSQPSQGATKVGPDGNVTFKRPWKGCPSPRGGHSGNVIGRRMYIFGGYGGFGYSRNDFNDVHELLLDTWEWRELKTVGEVPDPRSGHQTSAAIDKLYVCGGWNSVRQFDDLYILDIPNLTWSRPDGGSGPENWGPPRWNHTAVSVKSVPVWKIFVFGGNTGSLLEDGNPQGTYTNDMCVLETGTNTWSRYTTTGDIPAPRSDMQMVYDEDGGRIFVFGGWANRWYGDLYVAKVEEVVGPPYSIEQIEPNMGPITGKTRAIIRGKGFANVPGAVTVRYACPKGFIETSGEVVNDHEIAFNTPPFEKYGPVEVECRIAIGGKTLTNTVVHFSYFTVTSATTTVCFGPGVTNGCLATAPTSFVIQAKDKFHADRICGMDKFSIKIKEYDEAAEAIKEKAKQKRKSLDALKGDDIVNAMKGRPPTNEKKKRPPPTDDDDSSGGEGDGEGEGEDEAEEDSDVGRVKYNIVDSKDGTYIVNLAYPKVGKFKIDIDFDGTFEGSAGPIRGSPFTIDVVPEKGAAKDTNTLDGPLTLKVLTESTKEIKQMAGKTLTGLAKTIPKDDIKPLIKVKEHLKEVEERKEEIELKLDCNRSTLMYLKRKHATQVDRMVDNVDAASSKWQDVLKQVPLTTNTIGPLVKVWSSKTADDMEKYQGEVEQKREAFKLLDFWQFGTGPGEARVKIEEAEKMLEDERKALKSNAHLCNIFDFPDLIAPTRGVMDQMNFELVEMQKLWDVAEDLSSYIAETRQFIWKTIDPEELEDMAKAKVKHVKGLHRDLRWCDAYKSVDKQCKDFLNTIPLISLLGSRAMRPRHWDLLMKATGKEFVPPYKDDDLKLEGILSLNLHEFSTDVEEICDQAVKEEKMERTLEQLTERWTAIEWLMDPYKDTDIPLLKISEEDFECLETDQLTLQGMMASRFLAQFEVEVAGWQRALGNVADVFGLLTEIQRTWSYLEPLFIHSDEVKRELPEDAIRFAAIDVDVKYILKSTWERRNIKEACNVQDLLPKLESIQEQLDLCKKSLADFLDGRRRQFPRYYFTSEADLLDILSNGGTPEKVLKHTSKVYLSTKTLVLSDERTEQGRPYATKFISGVGVEEVDFEPKVPLEGKVEIYMQTVLMAMKVTLFENLKRSLVRYHEMARPEWLMHKDPKNGRPSDPAQIILLCLAVNYVQEVEMAFQGLTEGKSNAMKDFHQKHIGNLSDLIRLTQSDLGKGDRMRVMVCITMDAHSRDVVDKLIRDNVDSVSAFQWQSQLKHKWRQSPPNGSFKNRDPHLRGANGERAEIAIADAVMPYDYEYLGNGARLVITPLTDRIYVTATQALNLKMGCAPAGPAGTGKTESTKDLASALAKCCYVFNCSPEMDYQGLGNIFKGLASSGSWGCFDEFNRLVPEVLSVCSVQFKSVCDGVKAEAARIVIEGDEITLDPTCGAFITMNPGYLGRSELPEGLKALFRPMTVMVPDLVLICENMLMAEGFVTAKTLASKFYGLYSLLRELLSKQLHYDWGLRAVKSVLVVAGSFKRKEPDLEEDSLLMRALRDFNIPKIVREDEVVFFGLLGDLFPGRDPPRKVDTALESLVEQACEMNGNYPHEIFRLKVVQLEELLAIRHCVFVMGPPGAGKSQCWRTLAKARQINGDRKTKVVDINPKSLRTEELYGFISMATREWRDGLLSKIMRDLGLINDELPKWIILDGDLDANWIESMNSVMDDNRMLTLASNERVPLKPHMRMLFEIRDLQFATPATVSRAGILYISTDDGIQWECLIQSWMNQKDITEETKANFSSFFDAYIKPTLLWIKLNVKPIIPLEDMNMVSSLLYMLDASLTPKSLETRESLEVVFVYCAIWAFGSALSVGDDGTDYRKMFSDWWRGEWKKVKFPSRETVFDYYLSPETNTLDQWTKSPYISPIDFDSRTMSMSSITVQTPETCSVTFWMEKMVGMRRPVMLCGPAGTGKTQMVNGMLVQQDPADVIQATINFNFYTTSAVLQSTMAIPLVKKTGTNYGPPGKARLVYFVDDLNLPEVDPYNTQSAIALLRQHMEYEHVYDLSKLTVKNISQTQVVTCMNPTAGSFQVNPRLQRWFVTFAIGLPGPTSLLTIYQTFLEGHLQHFDPSVHGICNNLIKAALGLHTQVAQNFRKTATNFHYEFNIRHLSNVFQGLLISEPEQFLNAEKFVQLWLHESERVYGDRLVTLEDLHKYNGIAQGQCKKQFPNYNMSKFYAENADPLVFCHFADNISDKIYDQVQDLQHMTTILEDALKEYNETNAAMNLVLFEDAMKHVARVVRIVMNEGGHALLVGVGGSGKQSLARLAAFICMYNVSQIVISSTYGLNDLKEDLKVMYNKAGIKEEGVMFLLTDSQITNERFLIYINDLLASGNIPDLFQPDEQDTIVNSLTNKVKALGMIPDRKTCWDYFIKMVRTKLHVVLAFSPVGDDFRSRARKFPAIVNCTVIDWFQPWPKEALFSVGKQFMKDVQLGDDKIRAAIEKFLPYSFDVVNTQAGKFLERERRHVYTTPKSFLELLKLYGVLLAQKDKEYEGAIDRLHNGLQKLKDTSEAVLKLGEELKLALEEAEQKRVKAEGIEETVAKEKAIVEQENANAVLESEEVAKIQEEVSVKQRDTEEDLAKAEPAVIEAMAALNTLEKKELGECKTMAKPPYGVEDVFAATMILLAGVAPNVQTTKRGVVKDRSWDAAKKQLLGNIVEYIELLRSIKERVDNNTLPAINWKEVRPLLAMDHFKPDIIKSKNSAAAGLCSFVVNIVNYYDIVVTVEPKRLALAQANEQLGAANQRLKEVTEKVNGLKEKLAILTTEYNVAVAEKASAEEAVKRGQQKMELAQRLITALSSENERWGENIISLRDERKLLIGDVLLASAFISYVGPFSKPFRDRLMNEAFVPWLKKEFRAAVGEEGTMPMSEENSTMKILTTESEVALWAQDGLPADKVSIENGAIVTNSSRWPLIIDPQLQGIAWIKTKEGGEDRNLQVVRLGQKDMLRKLENALNLGHSVLIENLGESIDAVLNSVIQRATIKRGRTLYIKLGDTEAEFNPNFRLFLHTKLSNPHYPPEIQAETTLINFTVTSAGLEDQLLSLVVRKERPDLADLGEQLVQQQNGFKIKMKELEDNILFKLAAAEGDITEDVELIEGLEETKRISTDISKKADMAMKTQETIRITSEKYRPVARRSSLLFFLMNDLVKMHTYYIYSLAAFTMVFYRGIDWVSSGKLKVPTMKLDDESNAKEEEAGAEGTEGGEEGANEAGAEAKEGEAAVAPDAGAPAGDKAAADGAEKPAEGAEGKADEKAPEGAGAAANPNEAPKAEEDDPNRTLENGGDAGDAEGEGDGDELNVMEPTDEMLQKRCNELIQSITMTVYNYVRRGLFERHKLTFAAILTFTIAVNDGTLTSEEVDYLVMGKQSLDPGNMGPLHDWMPEPLWPKVKALEGLKRFQGLGDAMQSDSDDWQQWFDHEKPENAKLPGDYQKSLGPFDRLILLRSLRPDRVTTELQKYIADLMGEEYVFQKPFDMNDTYSETSSQVPMFFVLFPGVDPTPWVEDLGQVKGISLEKKNFINISMGQGQERAAENYVEKFAKSGGWVMLQNCHLMQSWLPKLERLLEVVQDGAHENFRCYISAEPPPPIAGMQNMPESLMQGCVKVANEAPSDIKSNLTRAWANFSQDRVDSSSKPTEFKACLFAICWFHSIVLGRRRFGQQGWSRAYSFNTGDLTICANVLQAYLDANPEVPWDDLRYIFGEIMYGGHITDAWDRRTNNTYLQVLFSEGLFQNMELGPEFKSPPPVELSFSDYLTYVDSELPPESPPLFGLHPNAEIGYLTNSTDTLFKTILSISGGSGDGGAGAALADGMKDTMVDLTARLPANFEMILLNLKAKPLLEGASGPFVVVALQECTRMNFLLTEMRRSLVELDKGLKGQLNMSQAMEDLALALTINEWPGRNPFAMCNWEKLAWPSKKSLLSQFADMLRRIEQLKAWVEELVPPLSIWLPGLFNPTAYLTAVMQVTARKTGSPLDKMTTETHITTLYDPAEADYVPDDGIFVHGLFIEGASWPMGDDVGETEMVGNVQTGGNLVDSRLKELLPALPLVYAKAVPVQPNWEPSSVGYLRHKPDIYECPVYITSFRGPTYVFLATLKTIDPVSKWVLTGTAIIMQTDD